MTGDISIANIDAYWPWKEGVTSAPQEGLDEDRLPTISVVTASYNQGRFIEATIRSVLEQNYPRLEYLIIDGGSTDESVDMIRRYEDRIDYWVSEPDQGQTHAINKGFERSSGEIMCWINSDDMLCPDALFQVARTWIETGFDALTGHTQFIQEDGSPEGRRYRAVIPDLNDLLALSGAAIPPQQSTFWTRGLWELCGPLKNEYYYIMDWELWMRFRASGVKWLKIDTDLALFRHHEAQKIHDIGNNIKVLDEKIRALDEFRFSKWATPALGKRAELGIDRARIARSFLEHRRKCTTAPFALRWLLVGLKEPAWLGRRTYYRSLLRGLSGK